MTVLPLGSSFAGYEIIEVIGEGSMGVVYRARDPRLDREVALKVVADHIAKDPAFRERFVQEARTAARIEHPSVITIHAAGEENGIPFIAMRLVRGKDLATILEQRGSLSPSEAISLLRPIAEGLDAAHTAGIVHRDVKPANILVPDDGSPAVLVDFGIGRVSQSTRATQTGSWVGTVDYVSPEQIRGADVDGRSDQYSLGCVLYEMIEGKPPFERGDAIQTMFAHANDEIAFATIDDQRVRSTIQRALSKDPAARFASCADVVAMASGSPPSNANQQVSSNTGTIIAPTPIVNTPPIAVAHTEQNPPAIETTPAPNRRGPKRRVVLIVSTVAIVVVGASAALAMIRLGASSSAPVVSATCSAAVLEIRDLASTAANAQKGQSYSQIVLVSSALTRAQQALAECGDVDPTAQGLAAASTALAAVNEARKGAQVTTWSSELVPLPRDDQGLWYLPDGVTDDLYDEIKAGSKTCYAYANTPAGTWGTGGVRWYMDEEAMTLTAATEKFPPLGWEYLDTWCEAIRGDRDPPDQVIERFESKVFLSGKAAMRIRSAGKQITVLVNQTGFLARARTWWRP